MPDIIYNNKNYNIIIITDTEKVTHFFQILVAEDICHFTYGIWQFPAGTWLLLIRFYKKG